MLNEARPWLTDRRLVVKPNIVARGAWAWMTSETVFVLQPWISPPPLRHPLITTPTNPYLRLMPTIMIVSQQHRALRPCTRVVACFGRPQRQGVDYSTL